MTPQVTITRTSVPGSRSTRPIDRDYAQVTHVDMTGVLRPTFLPGIAIAVTDLPRDDTSS